MAKNILVIGSSSMLGQRLCTYLEKSGFHIYSCGRRADCDIEYDLSNPEMPSIPYGFNADIVFHCASSFSDDSLQGCIINEKINALSAYVVGALALDIGCKHLIYSGSIFSCLVSGGESMTSYGASKLRGEDILEWQLRRAGIAFTSLRFPQFYDEHGECCRHQLWLGRIVAYAYAGKDLRMPGGRAKRNFLHVEDAVRLMAATMKRTVTGRVAVSHPESMAYASIAQQAYDVFSQGGFYEAAPEKQPFREICIPESTESFSMLDCWPQISMRDGLKMIQSEGSPQNFGPMDVI